MVSLRAGLLATIPGTMRTEARMLRRFERARVKKFGREVFRPTRALIRFISARVVPWTYQFTRRERSWLLRECVTERIRWSIEGGRRFGVAPVGSWPPPADLLKATIRRLVREGRAGPAFRGVG